MFGVLAHSKNEVWQNFSHSLGAHFHSATPEALPKPTDSLRPTIGPHQLRIRACAGGSPYFHPGASLQLPCIPAPLPGTSILSRARSTCSHHQGRAYQESRTTRPERGRGGALFPSQRNLRQPFQLMLALLLRIFRLAFDVGPALVRTRRRRRRGGGGSLGAAFIKKGNNLEIFPKSEIFRIIHENFYPPSRKFRKFPRYIRSTSMCL